MGLDCGDPCVVQRGVIQGHLVPHSHQISPPYSSHQGPQHPVAWLLANGMADLHLHLHLHLHQKSINKLSHGRCRKFTATQDINGEQNCAGLQRVSRSCIASSLSFRQRQPTFSDHKTHLQKLLSRSDESQHESFCKCFVPKVTDVVPDGSGSPQGLLTLPSPLTIISCFDNTTFSFCHL